MRLFILGLLIAGCGSDVVTCADDARCVRAGVRGLCLTSPVSAARFCAFADGGCSGGQRWDRTAGDGLSRVCVGGAPAGTADMADAAPQANGSACVSATQCQSTFCVDGVCCDRDCSGESCSACNLVGSVGTCTLVTNGMQPTTGHPTCGPDDKSTCKRDGTCDGKGACRTWPLGTVCGQSSCNLSTNRYTGPSTCDGKGSCTPGQQLPCDPYLCKDATSCFPSCTSSTGQCSGTNTCSNGSCGPKVTGTPCTGNGECASGFCVDGYCCGSSCTGQCQACDLGGTANGTCSTVVNGQPHGQRTPCTGSTIGKNPCAGQCDGAFPGKCDYPTSSCRTQTCSDATNVQLSASCDGAGSCPSLQTMSCGAYICSGAACKTSCSTAADCGAGAANDYCQGSQCYAKSPEGATCAHSYQCVGGCCCTDATPNFCRGGGNCFASCVN